MKARFRLGTLVATPGALDAAPSREALMDLVQRHMSGDWGDLDAHDRRQNEIAVRERLRILSAYELEGIRFWIITEADRSQTTILLLLLHFVSKEGIMIAVLEEEIDKKRREAKPGAITGRKALDLNRALR